MFQYAVCDDGIWIRVDDQISLNHEKKDSTSSFIMKNVAHMSASDDSLYLHVKDDISQAIRRVDDSGRTLAEWIIPEEISLYLFDVTIDGIIMLSKSDETAQLTHDWPGRNASLYFLRFDDGSVAKMHFVGMENQGVDVFAISGSTLCVQNLLDGKLSVIDLADNHVIAEFATQYEHMIIDDLKKAVYGLVEDVGTFIERLEFESGSRKVIHYVGDELHYAGLRGNAENLYVEDYENGRLIVVPIPPRETSESIDLTIIGVFDPPSSSRLHKAIEMFHMVYPDVDIMFRDVMDDVAFATSLMSGDPQIDIVSVQEYGALNAKAMLKAGVLVDFNDYPDITGNLNELIDQDSIFVDHGIRFGVPYMVMPYAWKVNEVLLSEMGISLPDMDWTWDDFFELSDQVYMQNQANDRSYYVLSDSVYPHILLQYEMNAIDLLGGRADFDTADFRSLMERWKIADERKLLALDIDHFFLEEDVRAPSLFQVVNLFYAEMGENIYVAPPKLYNHTLYPTRTVTLVVNKYSQNIDMATHFLACYLSSDAVSFDDPVSTGRQLRDMNLYTPTQYNEHDALPSPINDQLWESLLGQGIQESFYGDIMRVLDYELYPQYMKGQITLEEMITTIQTRADIFLGE